MNSISPLNGGHQSALTERQLSPHLLAKHAEIFGLLSDICDSLNPTAVQMEAAKANYEAVAEWMAQSTNEQLRDVTVYPHGSIGLGTTIRPLLGEEFDVDLICRVARYLASQSPAELKKLVGDRLRENARYAGMLEEKKRCWRLNYARQFHLDISPTIWNPRCSNGGELVPDKKLRRFKPTNPQGYRALFEQRAALVPRIRGRQMLLAEKRASVEPFPIGQQGRGVLRVIVQLLKRHRDIMFKDVEAEVAPISIILTTLAARAYERCVGMFTFNSELEVLIEVIRFIPHFIEREIVDGRTILVVRNETTDGENFADRWNSEPDRAKAFVAWQAKALADFEKLQNLEGMDRLTASLEESLGSVARRAVDNRTSCISEARQAKRLLVAPAIGLTTVSSAVATPVRPNTFFGDPIE